MSNSNLKKPGGKPGQRARKLDQPLSLKSDQQPSPKPAQQPDVKTPIEAAVAAPNALPIRAVAPATTPSAVAPATTPSAVAPATTPSAVVPANPASIDFQTIAMAYSNYTRKSFEQTKSFVEKLAGVRSLDKAVEIQIEFARQAYDTFVTESQRIRELYSGLARQNFQRFEGAVAKVIPAAR